MTRRKRREGEQEYGMLLFVDAAEAWQRGGLDALLNLAPADEIGFGPVSRVVGIYLPSTLHLLGRITTVAARLVVAAPMRQSRNIYSTKASTAKDGHKNVRFSSGVKMFDFAAPSRPRFYSATREHLRGCSKLNPAK